MNRLIVFCFSLGSLFTACKSTGTISIEVTKPAKITVSKSIDSILLVNNSLIKPKTSFKHDFQNHLFALDTLTTQQLIKTVGEVINESPKINNTEILPYLYFRDTKDLLQPLTWNTVHHLCNKNNSSSLLSLEAFGIQDTLVNYIYDDGYGYTYYKSMVLLVNSLWRIYDADANRIIDKKIHRDTIPLNLFESRNEYLLALSDHRNRDELSKQIAYEIAAKISDRFLPYWASEQRIFFSSGNSDMKLAVELVYNNQWDDAAKLWKKYTEIENNKIASLACYNMALVCEVQGKIDLALIWLEKSLDKYNNQQAVEYKRVLQKRQRENELLDKQFGIN